MSTRGGGYERRDAKMGPVLRFGVLLVVLVVFSLLVSHWLDEGLTPEPPPENPYAREPRRVAETTWPELQANPYEAITEHRERDARRLARYEWIDRQNGIARIPIGRAMEILLEREAEAGR